MNAKLALFGAVLALAACDQERTTRDAPTGRSTEQVRHDDGAGGSGGADADLDADTVEDGDRVDPRTEDIATGACPLGARRVCRVVVPAGCFEGAQYCVAGVWSSCVRDVSGGGELP